MFLSAILPAFLSNRFQRLAGLALLACAAPAASAQTPVVFGDHITDPGLYFLAGNQTGSGTGIFIESSDVTLLLGRFTLRGDGTDYGIFCAANDNVLVYGGRITNFRFGILMSSGRECSVKDVRCDHNAAFGLIAIAMRESAFLRLRCDYNGADGVTIQDCESCRFVSILAHDNDANGISIYDDPNFADGLGDLSAGNKIRLCWAAYNDLDGIRVVSDGHEIVSNQCVGNGRAGIHLALGGNPDLGSQAQGPGAFDNLVKSNWCVFNHDGIVADVAAHDNTLTNNIALANSGKDVVDDNDAPPCANTWFLNSFLTKGGDGAVCIF